MDDCVLIFESALLLLFSCEVVSASVRPPGLQRAWLPCPSLSLWICRDSGPLTWIFPSIGVFSNELARHIRWPKYWSFSFNNSPSNEYLALISFKTDWFELLAVQGTLKSFLQHHNSKSSILQHLAFFMDQLLHPYWKNHTFDFKDLCWQSAIHVEFIN